MDLWNILEYAAWLLSAGFAAMLVYDMVKVDSTYDNELLTSSREGELEAAQERHEI
ncbi:hypothetical protein [Rhodoligotrophos ferricapiens]|uniref:hypothetical protein n=1 Tax=Rhodoligotrophos ferricapiens TaxID=3069264 RepID=UPI00315DAC5B